jgi:purine-binding chemotaxis protein CheW
VAGSPGEILVFEMDGQRFGLHVSDVQELLQAVTVTPLPNAPVLVEGVINLRGQVVPVLDLRKALGLPARPVEPNDHLVVAQANSRRMVLRVDRALDLVRPPESDAAHPSGSGSVDNGVFRTAQLGDGLVFILDLDACLLQIEPVGLGKAGCQPVESNWPVRNLVPGSNEGRLP